MFAPLAMSLAVVAGAIMAQRTGDRASTAGGFILAAALLLARVILTASDPSSLAESMSLLGVAASSCSAGGALAHVLSDLMTGEGAAFVEEE